MPHRCYHVGLPSCRCVVITVCPLSFPPCVCVVPQIKCVKGDLFSCPQTDALAHCISEDCRMGAGIAVLFKKKFGGVQELLDQRE